MRAPPSLQPWFSALVLLLTAACAATFCAEASGVVDGKAIPIRSAPWAVAIVDRVAPGSPALCSGSILDSTHILTAAHCLYDPDGTLRASTRFVVTAGVSNYLKPSPTDNEQDRYVGGFRIHAGFTRKMLRFGSQAADDVAVLALTGPLDLNGPTARPIPLRLAPAPAPTGVMAVLAGFGVQSQTEKTTGALEEMTAKVAPQGICGFPPLGNQRALLLFNGVERCARSQTSSACYGDSGAGLVTTGARARLLGVAVGLATDCTPGSYSTYTYLGVAEISAFIQGSKHPPIAPRLSLTLDYSNPPRIGTSILCRFQGLNRTTHARYTFTTSSGRVLQSGPRTTYRVQRVALGTEVVCHAFASNAGGTQLAESRTAQIQKR